MVGCDSLTYLGDADDLIEVAREELKSYKADKFNREFLLHHCD